MNDLTANMRNILRISLSLITFGLLISWAIESLMKKLFLLG